MIFKCRAADLVDVLEHCRNVVLESQHRPHDVESAGQGSFGTGTVVADDVDYESIFAKTHLLKRINHSADLRIDVLQKTGEDLLHPCIEPPLIRRTRLPRWYGVGPGSQLGAFGDEPYLFLILKSDLALPIPTVIEPPLVLVSPLLGHMMGGMSGTRRKVDEERLVWRHCFLLTNPTDRLVRYRF